MKSLRSEIKGEVNVKSSKWGWNSVIFYRFYVFFLSLIKCHQKPNSFSTLAKNSVLPPFFIHSRFFPRKLWNFPFLEYRCVPKPCLSGFSQFSIEKFFELLLSIPDHNDNTTFLDDDWRSTCGLNSHSRILFIFSFCFLMEHTHAYTGKAANSWLELCARVWWTNIRGEFEAINWEILFTFCCFFVLRFEIKSSEKRTQLEFIWTSLNDWFSCGLCCYCIFGWCIFCSLMLLEDMSSST